MEDIFDMFRALDAATISDQLTDGLKTINQTIEAAKLDQTVAEFRITLQKVQHLVETERIDHLLTSVAQTSNNINKMTLNADGGISDFRKAVGRLDGALDSSGSDIRQMTADLQYAAGQLKAAMASAAALLKNADHQVNHLQRQAMSTLNRLDRAAERLASGVNTARNPLRERISRAKR